MPVWEKIPLMPSYCLIHGQRLKWFSQAGRQASLGSHLGCHGPTLLPSNSAHACWGLCGLDKGGLPLGWAEVETSQRRGGLDRGGWWLGGEELRAGRGTQLCLTAAGTCPPLLGPAGPACLQAAPPPLYLACPLPLGGPATCCPTPMAACQRHAIRLGGGFLPGMGRLGCLPACLPDMGRAKEAEPYMIGRLLPPKQPAQLGRHGWQTYAYRNLATVTSLTLGQLGGGGRASKRQAGIYLHTCQGRRKGRR